MAGSNGAGKSTTSKKLLAPYNITAFDWGIVFYKEWSKFGYDPLVEEGVRETANRTFDTAKSQAFTNKEHFAFETNFHVNSVFDIKDDFKNAGYKTVLHFLLVYSSDICRARVDKRVNIDQGHPVSTRTINYRFKQGLINLERAINEFDKVFIHNSSRDYQMAQIAEFEKGELVGKYEPLPDEVKELVPELAGWLG